MPRSSFSVVRASASCMRAISGAAAVSRWMRKVRRSCASGRRRTKPPASSRSIIRPDRGRGDVDEGGELGLAAAGLLVDVEQQPRQRRRQAQAAGLAPELAARQAQHVGQQEAERVFACRAGGCRRARRARTGGWSRTWRVEVTLDDSNHRLLSASALSSPAAVRGRQSGPRAPERRPGGSGAGRCAAGQRLARRLDRQQRHGVVHPVAPGPRVARATGSPAPGGVRSCSKRSTSISLPAAA